MIEPSHACFLSTKFIWQYMLWSFLPRAEYMMYVLCTVCIHHTKGGYNVWCVSIFYITWAYIGVQAILASAVALGVCTVFYMYSLQYVLVCVYTCTKDRVRSVCVEKQCTYSLSVGVCVCVCAHVCVYICCVCVCVSYTHTAWCCSIINV